MSESENKIQPPAVKLPKSTEMIRTLVLTALVCGFLIVTAFQTTLPTIKKNKARVLKQAVLEVVPGAVQSKIFKVDETGKASLLVGEDEKAKKFYAAYNGEGNLAGVAIETYGQGFQDVIRIIYGYSPEKQSIIGIKVLETKETPGLGDKIEKDPSYRANFEDLDVSLTSDGKRLKNEIEIVKKGKKTKRWQVDTITGATISSKAVGKMIQKSTSEDIPLVRKNLSAFKKEK